MTDGLANGSYNMGLRVCYFDSASDWIVSLLADDLIGVSRTRLISSTAM